MNKDFAKLCTPAKVYFALAVLAIIMSLFNRFTFLGIFIQLLFAVIWTMFLAWVCDKINPSISWFLVLAPYVMTFLVALGVMREIKQIRALDPMNQSTSYEGMTANNGTRETRRETRRNDDMENQRRL